jgi:hypothetical protein
VEKYPFCGIRGLLFKPYFVLTLNLLMKAILSERNLAVILFVMVLITFSLAQEDSKKMEKMYTGTTTMTASALVAEQPALLTGKKDLPAPAKD